jgi:hypothetical protein
MEESEATAGDAAGGGSPGGLVGLGALVLIGVYLVFGLLMNEYWVSWLALSAAIVAVLVSRVDWFDGLGSKAGLLKALGYLLGIIGALTIIEDLRFAGSVLDSVVEVAGALIAYVGFVMAFLGARSISS